MSKERVVIYVDQDLRARFEAAAKAERRTLSEYIHYVLECWAERKLKDVAPKWKNKYASEDEVRASLDDVLVPKDEL